MISPIGHRNQAPNPCFINMDQCYSEEPAERPRVWHTGFPDDLAIGKWFAGGHETVSHAKFEYARGDVSTNEVESYFALLKRGIAGSFHLLSN
jgi:hypothetical protein